MLKKLICILLVIVMVGGILVSCADKGNEGDGTSQSTETGTSNNNDNNNNNSNNNNNNNNNSSNQDKYPWLGRVFRFDSEEFKLAAGEQEGIVAYLMSAGAIAADETDEEKINEVLNSLAAEYRNSVQFLTASSMKIISDDFSYEQDFLYKVDAYKNLALFDTADTAMKTKLDLPTYTFAVDGSSLTLKVPFSYTVESVEVVPPAEGEEGGAEGDISGEGVTEEGGTVIVETTVECKSYSLLTFTRDDETDLGADINIENKSFVLKNYVYRFASDEDLIAFEIEKGMSFEAWLEAENETVTESNASTVRLSEGKLIGEKTVVSGVTITEFAYYATVTESGEILLYSTEQGRDDANEDDRIETVVVSITPDGKNIIVAQPISEGSESMKLRIYEFDKPLEEVVLPGVLGKIFILNGYSYRFTSEADRNALEASKGKTVEKLIEEANATITAENYKILTVGKSGTFVCESISGNGAAVSEFTYYGTVSENGEITLYNTAAGRGGADANDIVKGVSIAATADGVEIAYALNDSLGSASLELFGFDKVLEKEELIDVWGNSYTVNDYSYRFNNDADMVAFENSHGMTISEIIAQKKSELYESYTRLAFERDGRVVCERVTGSVVSIIQFQYYADIAEDGTVTLYNTAAGRDSKDQNDIASTDVILRVTSTGVEITQPISSGSKSVCIETFEFTSEIPVFGACPDLSGQYYNSSDRYLNFVSESELTAFESAQGMTAEKYLEAYSGVMSGRIYIDNSNRIFNLTSSNTLGFLYYMSVENDGTVTLYNTAGGRSSKLASDIADTDMKITVSSGGKTLTVTMPLANGSKNTYAVTFNFSNTFTDSNMPTVANQGYKTADGSVYWIFDANENLSYFENSLLNYEYYASVYNGGEMLLFIDDDSRYYEDPTALASNIDETIVLVNGKFIYVKLTSGEVIWMEQIWSYSGIAEPILQFDDSYTFDYILNKNMVIVDPLEFASVKNGSFTIQVIWYRNYGDYRERISGTPSVEGNYIFKLVVAPGDGYRAAYLEKEVSIVSMDTYLRNAVKLDMNTTYDLTEGVTYYITFTPEMDSNLYIFPSLSGGITDVYVFKGNYVYEGGIYNTYYGSYWPSTQSSHSIREFNAGDTYTYVFTVTTKNKSGRFYLIEAE